MTYADYALGTPTWVQFLLSVLITAGVSLLLVRVFHRQLLRLAQEPEHDEDDPTPEPPASHHLSGRIIQVTSLGFVFLFSFTVGQFVINYRNADTAVHLEAQYFGRALAGASQLPAEMGRDDVVSALEAYRTTVLDEGWPLMQRGDATAAYVVQSEAATMVTMAAARSAELGASETLGWGSFSSSVDDLLVTGTDRIGDVPNSNAVSLLVVTIFLGVMSLAMTAIFQPTRMGINLTLIGIMAATYGVLFFVVVELSNPFQGGGAIPPPLFLIP